MSILDEDQYTFVVIYPSILLRIKNVSDKSCQGNKTYILCLITFFKNSSADEIMWKNIVEPYRPQFTIWCMSSACWKTKATNAQSGYVILIAFSLLQWLRAHASVLCYTYVAFLLLFYFTEFNFN